MIPQNELQKYFRQGLSYIVNILTSHYDILVRLRYHTHEVVLVIELLVQSFYLWRKKATYSEFFFGFRRSVADPATKSLKPLAAKHIGLSLVFEVLLPYLKHYLEHKLHESERLR
jgi:hypothetical protein